MSQLSELLDSKRTDGKRALKRVVEACSGDGIVVTGVGVRHVASGLELYQVTQGNIIQFKVKKKDAITTDSFTRLSLAIERFADLILDWEEHDAECNPVCARAA